MDATADPVSSNPQAPEMKMGRLLLPCKSGVMPEFSVRVGAGQFQQFLPAL